MLRSKILGLFLFGLLISQLACESSATDNQTQTVANDAQNEKAFVETLQKHLNAVSNKDLASLEGTMSPENKTRFIPCILIKTPVV